MFLANTFLGLPPETIFNSVQSILDMEPRPLLNTSLYVRPGYFSQLGTVLGMGAGMIAGAVAGVMSADFIVMRNISK